MPSTSTESADPARLTDQDVYRAEQLRAELTDFWGRPHLGVPLGADLTQAMLFTDNGGDIGFRPELAPAHLFLCEQISDAFDGSTVWAAPHAMTRAISAYPLLAEEDGLSHVREEDAPARDGLVYFPHPITGHSAHPIYGLAWQMTGGAGTGDPIGLACHTITRTRLIPTLLPAIAHPRHWAETALSCNSLVLLESPDRPAVVMGRPLLWGAPDPQTTLRLILAFWSLRPPRDQEDERSVPQRTSKKNKKGARPKRRRVRVIRENALTRPAGESTGVTRHWNDDTLRWQVEEKWQWRCPDPRRHAEIIASGGTCPKVRVKVKAHDNGPKGRSLDPRRAVRIPAVPADQAVADTPSADHN
ncbi:hypothetical protein [Streptomyces acidiscabies]|uniref:Uncharacterized protein n=1 Tax=Streptomyces acidiscabies TaxID=42234 RepID=A0ABU4LX37_9ACTN|nr:hypothetical protein [Streptomyces acidiscabies]MDX3020042.1 hypothetical protein [Streptomyces acidiscabies]